MKITHMFVTHSVFSDARDSVDAAKHQAEFMVAPGGVLVRRSDGSGKHPIKLVPWSNIRELTVEIEPGDPQFPSAAKARK